MYNAIEEFQNSRSWIKTEEEIAQEGKNFSHVLMLHLTLRKKRNTQLCIAN